MKSRTTKPKDTKTKNDAHLANLIRRCREDLQENKPVKAHMWLENIEMYLYEEY